MTTTDVAEWRAQTTFDRYARLVRSTLDVPTAMVTILEPDRQVFPGVLGLPEPYQSARETPLTHSFCQHVVADESALIISDAREHPRVQDNLAIPDLGVIAYAGWPLRDDSGRVVGALCAIDGEPHEWTPAQLNDLEDLADACSTELAQRGLTVRMSAVIEELERSNGHLTAFAGQVSHDLRNPLTAMAGALEMLHELQVQAGVEEDSESVFLLARAQRSTRRMTELVAAVLDFARVGGQLRLDAVDPAAVVADVVEDLHLAPGLVSVGDLPPLRADRVQLKVLVQNLLANAVTHAPGSAIDVSATIVGGRWRMAVADHGPGIAAADRERAFGSFVRLQNKHAGTGLGLATCRRAVAAHRGSIELVATPGGGTTVLVDIPLDLDVDVADGPLGA